MSSPRKSVLKDPCCPHHRLEWRFRRGESERWNSNAVLNLSFFHSSSVFTCHSKRKRARRLTPLRKLFWHSNDVSVLGSLHADKMSQLHMKVSTNILTVIVMIVRGMFWRILHKKQELSSLMWSVISKNFTSKSAISTHFCKKNKFPCWFLSLLF